MMPSRGKDHRLNYGRDTPTGVQLHPDLSRCVPDYSHRASAVILVIVSSFFFRFSTLIDGYGALGPCVIMC